MILRNEPTTKEKILGFLKKYSYVIIAITLLIILSITMAVTVSKTRVSDKNYDNDNVVPTGSSVTSFYLPVLNCSAIKDYSDTKLMYNETLKQWEAHKALDLTGNAGDNVYAALDGKVVAVYDNYLEGKVIELEHQNNLKTIYKSLGNTKNLEVGDVVSRGQVIGTLGTSAGEAHLGNHLHFEVEESGKKIDPSGYLNLTDK